MITLLLLVRASYMYGCCSSRTSRSWGIAQSTQRHRRGCNNIPSFIQRTAPIARSLCEGWTPHDLHILVTAPFCCDWKVRAASAPSFTLWQQATIKITPRDHSIIACSRHVYMGVVLRAHPVRGGITQSTQHHRRGCNSRRSAGCDWKQSVQSAKGRPCWTISAKKTSFSGKWTPIGVEKLYVHC